MPKSKAPRIIPHFPPEHQQEAILAAVLNIEAHMMTMAELVITIHTKMIVAEQGARKEFPAQEVYKSNFYRSAETLQKAYSALGRIDML